VGAGVKQRILQAKDMCAEFRFFSRICSRERHINVLPDLDGKYRRVPLLIKYKDAFYPYLSLRLILDYLAVDPEYKIETRRIFSMGPNTRIPLDEESNMIVNYAGRWESIISIILLLMCFVPTLLAIRTEAFFRSECIPQ